MAEGTARSVEARETSADSPWPPPGWLSRQPVKAWLKGDLLPAVNVLSTTGLTGVLLGWLWSLLAPAERTRVVPGSETPVPLDLESWHKGDDLVVFSLLALGLGLLIGIGVWLLRERRGPVVLLAAVGGATLAGWLGTLTGSGFAQARYAIGGAPALGDFVTVAPVLGSVWALLFVPMGTVLVYGFLAAWNGREDLGRRLG